MIGVIGAGPAGAYSAYLLAKSGYDVDIYEEHNSIGSPVQCTGIVTSAITEILAVKSDLIVNRINRVKVIAPNNNSIDIKLKIPDLVLDRARFDQALAQQAVDAGAGLFTNHRLTGMEGKKLQFTASGKTRFVEHNKVIIGADGPLSVVGRNLGSSIRDFFIGSQAVVEDEFEKDCVEIFLLKQGFGWILPEDDRRARVGVFGYKHAAAKLDEILKAHLPNSKTLVKQGGLIPVYNPRLNTYKDGVYLVGDAAGMVKATTGGGIVQALTAAVQLEKSIRTRQNYESLWKQKLSKPLLLHLAARKMLDRFNDAQLNQLVDLTAQDKMKELLGRHSRDKPLDFALKLIKTEPKYLLFLKNLLLPEF